MLTKYVAPVYLPFYQGGALKHAVLEYNNGLVNQVDTPHIDWEDMHFIQMGRDTLFGVKDGSTDTFKVIKAFAHD